MENIPLKTIEAMVIDIARTINQKKKLKAGIKFGDILNKNRDSKSITIYWEFLDLKRSKTELEHLINMQDYIHEADMMIYKLMKECESQGLTYTGKLYKSKYMHNELLAYENGRKLRAIFDVPVYMQSFLAINFPLTDYYIETENETLKDAVAEFWYRKDNGFYDKIDLNKDVPRPIETVENI